MTLSRLTSSSLPVWALAALSACSSGTGSSSDDASIAESDAGTAPSALVGAFVVRLTPPEAATASTPAVPGYTSVVGKISDGPTPEQIIWEEVSSESGCTLLTPRVPFCEQPCGGSAACVADNTCQNYPTARDVGTVSVSGMRTTLGATQFTMTAVAKVYQPPNSVDLPFPAFDEGALVRFDISGGEYAQFSLEAKGIRPLALTSTAPSITRGRPLALTWPSGRADVGDIYVRLDISHHGGTRGKIECTVEDTGTLTISAALLDALTDLGIAGFPTIVVSRKARGSTSFALGRVNLELTSDVELAVEIPGLTSCTSDPDCPTGQTCQTDLSCR